MMNNNDFDIIYTLLRKYPVTFHDKEIYEYLYDFSFDRRREQGGIGIRRLKRRVGGTVALRQNGEG